jgi:hypothetical protein
MPKRSKVRCDCSKCNGKMVDRRTRKRHNELITNRTSEEPSLPTMDLIQENSDDSQYNIVDEQDENPDMEIDSEDTNIDRILP